VENALQYGRISNAGESVFAYAETPAGLTITAEGQISRMSISHCDISGNNGYGIFVDRSVELTDFSNNTISSNQSGAIFLYAPALAYLDASNDYGGNSVDQIFIHSYDPLAFGQDATWINPGVPYVIGPVNDDLEVYADLIISGGCELKFQDGCGMLIGETGSLTADGGSSGIRFTGSASIAGHWKGLRFHKSENPANALTNVTLEYFGSSVWSYAGQEAGIVLTSTGEPVSLDIRSSSIQNGTGAGIWVAVEGTLNADAGSVNSFSSLTAGDIVFE
jgi:parallel beta-helix repeat protein